MPNLSRVSTAMAPALSNTTRPVIAFMNNPTTLPHRFRESSFRKYEHFLTQAVNAYPKTIAVWPRSLGLSPVTFACRCRDAITSYKQHRWDSTINAAKFREVADLLIVSERDNGSILIGSREAMMTPRHTAADYIAATDTPVLTLTTKAEKDFLMQLSHKRVIMPQLHIVGLTDAEAAVYQGQYDIALNKHSDTVYVLI